VTLRIRSGVPNAARGLIVGVAMTQEAEDSGQLLPAVERLKEKPQQLVADGGYTTRENIEQMAERNEYPEPSTAQRVYLRPRARRLPLSGRQVVKVRLPAQETIWFGDVPL
jgi:hypothetical protein